MDDSTEEKFGISLPSHVLEELEAQAKKLGKTRSSLIKDIVTESMQRTTQGEEPTGRRIDENAAIRRLIADSTGIGFDMEGDCARRAVTREIVGEEWDPTKYPERLKIILRRQKENDDYWSNGEDTRYERIEKFARIVQIDKKMLIKIAKEVGYID